MMYTSKDRWFFTADKREVVRESDPRAAFLYAGVGTEVPMEEAERYGILDMVKDAVTDLVVDNAACIVEAIVDAVVDVFDGDDEPDTKAITADAIENKAVTPKATTRKRR